MTTNIKDFVPALALDLGAKRVGVAVSDGLGISIKPLEAIKRTNWKQLLRDVADLVQQFDAQTVVIGLPLALNGTESEAASEARQVARKFALSLRVPVYLQDERLSSVEAEHNIRSAGHGEDLRALVDSEAAGIILRDFLVETNARTPVEPGSSNS